MKKILRLKPQGDRGELRKYVNVEEYLHYSGCIEAGILSDVLSEERAATMLEILTTFDEDVYREGLRIFIQDKLDDGGEKSS